MSRRWIAAALMVVVAAVLVVFLARDDQPQSTRIAVVFDTARGVVPGQFVKIAGARVGRVADVELTAAHRARLMLEIEREHAAFRADATCRILPEGPISENFVDCDPGTAGHGRLASDANGIPTIPVTQTSAPVSIQDLLNVFAAPAESRIRILINELGIGTAARGDDLNDVLRRGNPALREVNGLLAQVNAHTTELTAAITQTDQVLGAVAERDVDVRRFVTDAATTMRVGAGRRQELAETIQRLPRLLRATRASLRTVDRAAAAGTPLLAGIRHSAPQLRSLMPALRAFSRRGASAVREAATAAREARGLVSEARPVAKSLRTFAQRTGPFSEDLKRLLVSTRDQGGLESILSVFYTLATVSALHDGTSHLLTASLGLQPQCGVEGLDLPGCSHAYNAHGNGQIPINDPTAVKQRGQILRDILAALRDKDKKSDSQAKDRPATPALRPTPAPSTTPSKPDVRPGPAVPELLDGLADVIGGVLGPRPSLERNDLSTFLDYLFG